MQKIAEALEISVAELLGEEATAVRTTRKNGQTSKVQKAFEEVSRLPRPLQDKIVEFVTAFVRQYEQAQK
jgi:hypothetical protein